MRRWKITVLGLLTVVTAVIGPVALVTPIANARQCEGPSGEPLCTNLLGSTPECMNCRTGACVVYAEAKMARPEELNPDVIADYVLVNGTAELGRHFTGERSGQIRIAAGAMVGSTTIQVLPPERGAPERVFYVELIRVSTGAIGNSRIEVHILAGQ
jgi:hypothetical protein